MLSSKITLQITLYLLNLHVFLILTGILFPIFPSDAFGLIQDVVDLNLKIQDNSK